MILQKSGYKSWIRFLWTALFLGACLQPFTLYSQSEDIEGGWVADLKKWFDVDLHKQKPSQSSSATEQGQEEGVKPLVYKGKTEDEWLQIWQNMETYLLKTVGIERDKIKEVKLLREKAQAFPKGLTRSERADKSLALIPIIQKELYKDKSVDQWLDVAWAKWKKEHGKEFATPDDVRRDVPLPAP